MLLFRFETVFGRCVRSSSLERATAAGYGSPPGAPPLRVRVALVENVAPFRAVREADKAEIAPEFILGRSSRV